LDTSVWGKGLATEAGLAAIEYGFDRFNSPYILGCVESENIRSVKVLENLGMQYKSKTVVKGVKMDIYRLDNSKK
jgi:RimJ/RimL family protein N-acetyltransferase